MASLQIVRVDSQSIGVSYDLLHEAYRFMSPIFEENYPNFKSWYYNKVIQEMRMGRRVSYIVQDQAYSNIYGVSIMKLSTDNNRCNKICSLYLDPTARAQGIGHNLLREISRDVNYFSSNPFTSITVSEVSLVKPENRGFLSFLNSFGLSIRGLLMRGYYKPGYSELVLAGRLQVPALC